MTDDELKSVDDVLNDPIFLDYCDAMDGMQEFYRKEFKKQERREKRIKACIIALLGKRKFNAIFRYSEPNYNIHDLRIVRNVGYGKRQRSEIRGIKWEWVDQYMNGGYEGDDFAGYIYLQLKSTPDRFLRIQYQC